MTISSNIIRTVPIRFSFSAQLSAVAGEDFLNEVAASND
jgi:hypothetical protein